MVFTNIRFQLAAVVILLIVLVDYLRNPHLKILTNKVFCSMVSLFIVNIILDISTVYCANHLYEVSARTNRILHQCFFGSIVLMVYIIYMYVAILANAQKRISKSRLCLSLSPFLVTMLFVAFGEFHFVNTVHGCYSYGQIIYVIFASAAVYFFCILFHIVNPKNELTVKQRGTLKKALLVWALAWSIQLLIPWVLMSGFAFSLFVLIIYISQENQRSYFDSEIDGFNQAAFHMMLPEYFERRKDLTMVTLVLENLSSINTIQGYEEGKRALKYVYDLVYRYLPEDVFRSRANSYTVFFEETPEECKEQIDRLYHAVSHNDYRQSNLQCHIDVIDVRNYFTNKNQLFDTMMYMSRKSTRKACTLHYLDEHIMNRKMREERIEELLLKTLKEKRFEVVYQPIYWPEKKAFGSAEALVRMPIDEQLGYISPEEFIPVAEQKGLIMEIGDCVLEKVAKFWRRFRPEQHGFQYIEVNLSGIQAGAVKIDKRLNDILEKYKVDAKYINLEITETAATQSGQQLQDNMQKLREAGFSFSMDDFGTGYSNLSQMVNINYDLIKIDKSLIWPAFGKHLEATSIYDNFDNMKQDYAKNLLEYLLQMLHGLQMSIVAEGIETQSMAEYLIANGVQHLQGYYYSRPLSEDDFAKIVKEQ